METTPLYNVYDSEPWTGGNPTIELDHGARRLVSYGYPVAEYGKDGKMYRMQHRSDEEMFRHIREFVRQLTGEKIDPIDWFYMYEVKQDPFRPGLPDPVSPKYAGLGLSDRTKPYDYDAFEHRF